MNNEKFLGWIFLSVTPYLKSRLLGWGPFVDPSDVNAESKLIPSSDHNTKWPVVKNSQIDLQKFLTILSKLHLWPRKESYDETCLPFITILEQHQATLSFSSNPGTGFIPSGPVNLRWRRNCSPHRIHPCVLLVGLEGTRYSTNVPHLHVQFLTGLDDLPRKQGHEGHLAVYKTKEDSSCSWHPELFRRTSRW